MKKNTLKILTFTIIFSIFFSTTVYAATTYLASNIKYKNTNVENALNELYEKKVITKTLTVNETYQLDFGNQFTYKTSDENVLTVDEKGLITVKTKGNAIVSVLFENKEIIRYNVKAYTNVFEITSAKCHSYNSALNTTDKEKLNKIRTYLIDRVLTKQGSYGALMLSLSYPYVYFALNENANIIFTSNSYSDSGGSSGKTVNFYKVDSNNNETLYYTLKQENNKQNYGKKYFEKGNYVIRAQEKYVEFDEWTIIPE